MTILTYKIKDKQMVTTIIEEPLLVWLANNKDAVIINTEKLIIDTEEKLNALEYLKKDN